VRTMNSFSARPPKTSEKLAKLISAARIGVLSNDRPDSAPRTDRKIGQLGTFLISHRKKTASIFAGRTSSKRPQTGPLGREYFQ
jgi:hypothetical protein